MARRKQKGWGDRGFDIFFLPSPGPWKGRSVPKDKQEYVSCQRLEWLRELIELETGRKEKAKRKLHKWKVRQKRREKA